MIIDAKIEIIHEIDISFGKKMSINFINFVNIFAKIFMQIVL